MADNIGKRKGTHWRDIGKAGISNILLGKTNHLLKVQPSVQTSVTAEGNNH